MGIADLHLSMLQNVLGVMGVLCGRPQQVNKPRRRLVIGVDIQVLIPNHVGEEESLDLAQSPVLRPFRSQVACPVKRVLRAPFLDRLFAVVEH